MAQDIATPYRDPRSAFGNRKIPAIDDSPTYDAEGNVIGGGGGSAPAAVAPSAPSSYGSQMGKIAGSIARNIFSAPGSMVANLQDQAFAAPPPPAPVMGQAAAAPDAATPPVAPVAPVRDIANIMPPQPPGNVPLAPTDSATGAPVAANIAAPAPVAAAPTLDASTQLALSAARSDAAGRVDPGVQGGGIAGFADSATAARNAGMDANRTRYLAEQALNHGGVMRGPAAYAAIENAGANAAGERNVALQTQAATQTALARNGAELNIAHMNDATHRYTADSSNLIAARGQDIGAATHAAGAKNALDVAALHGASAAKVADITSEGRIAAAENRAVRPVVVGGGQEPYVDPATGLTSLRLMPQRVVDSQTGQEIGQPAPKPVTIATDPKALAIKNNTALSIDEKRAQLKALGY